MSGSNLINNQNHYFPATPGQQNPAAPFAFLKHGPGTDQGSAAGVPCSNIIQNLIGGALGSAPAAALWGHCGKVEPMEPGIGGTGGNVANDINAGGGGGQFGSGLGVDQVQALQQVASAAAVASQPGAFLGPKIWEKTINFDDDFKLEYMDLDEFLTENDLPIETVLQEQQQIEDDRLQDHQQQPPLQESQGRHPIMPPNSQSAQPTSHPSSGDLLPPTGSRSTTNPPSSSSSNSSCQTSSTSQPQQQQQHQRLAVSSSTTIKTEEKTLDNGLVDSARGQTPGATAAADGCHSSSSSSSTATKQVNRSSSFNCSPGTPSSSLASGLDPPSNSSSSSAMPTNAGAEKVSSSSLYNPFHDVLDEQLVGGGEATSSGSSKSSLINCDPLCSPGGGGGGGGSGSGLFKSNPVVRKRKKQMVLEECKDDKYWERRRKNNIAAKRSRDARRAKENQIAMRATFLERENKALAQELSKARAENHLLRERLCKYEAV